MRVVDPMQHLSAYALRMTCTTMGLPLWNMELGGPMRYDY
jgi:hypothetical protein